MKKFGLLLPLIMLSGLLLLILSQSGCSHRDYYFFLKSVKASTVVIAQDSVDTSMFRIEKIVKQDDTCDFKKTKLHLYLEGQVLVKNNFNFINTAYAFKPAPSFYTNVDKIKTINIYTLYPYNQHPAGSEISKEIFKPKEVDDLMEFLNSSIESYGIYAIDYYLSPTKAPNALSKQQFVVELISENNTILKDTSEAFYLKP